MKTFVSLLVSLYSVTRRWFISAPQGVKPTVPAIAEPQTSFYDVSYYRNQAETKVKSATPV